MAIVLNIEILQQLVCWNNTLLRYDLNLFLTTLTRHDQAFTLLTQNDLMCFPSPPQALPFPMRPSSKQSWSHACLLAIDIRSAFNYQECRFMSDHTFHPFPTLIIDTLVAGSFLISAKYLHRSSQCEADVNWLNHYADDGHARHIISFPMCDTLIDRMEL